jgi:hypothetical protein
MADKKITALSSIAATEVESTDLLHIVDNPGGTPVNKKMSLATLFQNIPSTLACDSIETETTAQTNLGSNDTLVTKIDISGSNSDIAYTLDNGNHVGQLKIIIMTTDPGDAAADANITVTSWGSSSASSNQIVLDGKGEAVICLWDGSAWYSIAESGGATVS